VGSNVKKNLLASAAMVFALALADEAAAMSLQEAVQQAVNTNPEVGAVANDRLAVDEELRQGRGLYYPQVDLRSENGAQFSENPTTDGQGNDRGRTLFRSVNTLTLSQLIFDGHFADSEVERQKARVDSAAHRVAETSESIGLDAVEAYLEVSRHRERVRIAEENVGAHDETLRQVRLRLDAGGGNIADVRQAETRLAAAKSNLVRVQGDLADNEAFFQRVVGDMPGDLDSVSAPVDMLPPDVDQAITNALGTSPTLAFADSDIRTADQDIRQQEASLYPDVRLQLSGQNINNPDGRVGTDWDAQAQIVLRWNLYRGGADAARIREFKHRKAEAEDQRRIHEREVSENVRKSWNAVQTTRADVALLQERVASSVQTRDVYADQFKIGQRGLLDVLDAENELYLARDSLVTASNAYIFASYRLIAAGGNLTASIGATRPETAMPLPE
jgi:adhesin transport system outer membrane protein